MRYNYRVVTSAFFTKVLRETVKRLAKLARIKYRCDGDRVIIYADTRDRAEMLAKLVMQYFCYADTRDRAEMLAKLVMQYFCVVLTYKYYVPHTFCEISVTIEENK